MATYPTDSHVTIRPFTHTREGELARIADVEREVVLEIPAEGLDILVWLGDGRSVGEAARLYEEKYGEAVDIEDFLAALEDEGFVGPEPGAGQQTDAGTTERAAQDPSRAKAHRSWHGLPGLSQRTAQRMVSRPVVTVGLVIIAVGVAAVIHDPAILPTPGEALLFPIHFAALFWGTIALTLLGVLIHELAHVVAVRAADRPARMGIGNQQYVIVAQTDMTGMWLNSKRQRYLAFTVGMLVDGVQAAAMLAALWAERRGYIALPQWLSLLLTALVLTSLIRIGWQFYFFFRTDGYYVFVTRFDCKNLMHDTEDFIRNMVKRVLRPSSRRVDQSGLPARERRAIRIYSVLYLAGRVWFAVVFFFIAVPILWGMAQQAGLFVLGRDSRFSSIDFASVAAAALFMNVTGSVLWARSVYRRRRERLHRDRLQHRRETARSERLRHAQAQA